MKTITTLEDIEFSTMRRCGNTTRQIDIAIQKLFEGYKIIVIDHHDTKNSNELLLQRILRRLESEHRLSELIKNNKIKINKGKEITIQLL